MSESGGALLAVAGVLALGAMSPGASFILVARLAATRSRAAGLAAAVGMGLGCAVFALLALCGLQALLERVPALHRVLSVAGGAYLLWLAWRMWQRDPADEGVAASALEGGTRGAFVLGLLTQLGNPQTALVFASMFAALLPPVRAATDYLVLPALAFTIDALWFALVACALSAPLPQRWWLRARRPLDRCSAALMAGLGTRLLLRAP
ncbi:LysE family transporter [Pseudoxanthomonas sp.]|uniref:LysE family translocator n=1 Tax=Pseudoxanthomonas sp. TaxID=1871049 RepID=UPI00261645B3|nr:LysE family transporter [Pseudoxanthomonas sp.]WDS37318.1 MAG: LysE family transporter [Pseudoxanthomonas sp.]